MGLMALAQITDKCKNIVNKLKEKIMKIIISKFRKFLCLMLSFILLSNSIPVFGQDVDMANILTHQKRLESINREFEYLRDRFNFLKEDYNNMLKHVEKYNEPTGSRINTLDIEPFIKLYPDVQLEHAFFKELNGKGTDELIEIFSQRYLTDAPENTIVTLTAKDNEMIAKLKGQLDKTCYIKEYTPGYTWQWIIEKRTKQGKPSFQYRIFFIYKR